MYSVFQTLCNQIHKKPTAVGRELGIAPATISDWKSNRSTPKTDKLQKIADYFNVSIEYLTTGQEKASIITPTLNEHDQDMVDKYNALDTSGKKMVDQTLLIQYERVMTETNKILLLHEDPAQYGTLAAHKKEDASIDDTTDDIKKMAQKVEGLKKGNNEQLRDSSTDLC